MSVDAPNRPAPARRTVSRTAETWITGIGLGLAALLQGGFTVTINNASRAEFDDKIAPALASAGLSPAGDVYETARTLAAWFGFSLVIMILLAAIALFIASRRPARRSTGWWLAAAGAVCLVGTQLVLYPVAFFFFLAAALFAVRPTSQGSPA
ncbi:MAG: hypothetical protein ACTH2J_01215 [Candidatus Microbacterium stercoravium]